MNAQLETIMRRLVAATYAGDARLTESYEHQWDVAFAAYNGRRNALIEQMYLESVDMVAAEFGQPFERL